MIFGFFRQHKLPAFPPEAAAVFRQLCVEVPVEVLGEVRAELERAVTALRAEVAAGKYVEHTEAVERLAAVSFRLLDAYPELSLPHRKLALGAIRYFAIGDDSLSDTHFATGFLDDIRVMNYVLEELGFEEDYISS